uniref:Follitropin subunit beta n=1 Tax=Sphenodon punctatus TaxID=8508 RepID=A0A8D0L4E4_SPHPU
MKTVNFYALLLCWKAISCNICELSNITITVEREECGFCVSVNATWCSGYCDTMDPIYRHPLVPSLQQTCTFKELVYETVKLPGCAGHAESFYSYPVATGCHCGSCDTDSTDCTVRGLGPGYCSFNQNQNRE